MIPDLPEGISADKVLSFYSQLIGNLQDQSTIHINWFTHRRNPSVCWICDLYALTTKVIELADQYISKSTVDLETDLMSENESDTESEPESMVGYANYDEEVPCEPEYDVEDPEQRE